MSASNSGYSEDLLDIGARCGLTVSPADTELAVTELRGISILGNLYCMFLLHFG